MAPDLVEPLKILRNLVTLAERVENLEAERAAAVIVLESCVPESDIYWDTLLQMVDQDDSLVRASRFDAPSLSHWHSPRSRTHCAPVAASLAWCRFGACRRNRSGRIKPRLWWCLWYARQPVRHSGTQHDAQFVRRSRSSTSACAVVSVQTSER